MSILTTAASWAFSFTLPGKAAPPAPRGLGVQPVQVDDSVVLRGPNAPSVWPRGFSSFPKSLSQPVTHPQPPPSRQAAQSCITDCERRGGIWPLRSRQASSQPHRALGSPVFSSRADSQRPHFRVVGFGLGCPFCLLSLFCTLGTSEKPFVSFCEKR